MNHTPHTQSKPCIVCLVNAAIEGWLDHQAGYCAPEQFMYEENRDAYRKAWETRAAMVETERMLAA